MGPCGYLGFIGFRITSRGGLQLVWGPFCFKIFITTRVGVLTNQFGGLAMCFLVTYFFFYNIFTRWGANVHPGGRDLFGVGL